MRRSLGFVSLLTLVLTLLSVTEGVADKKKKQKKNMLERPVSIEAMDGPMTLSSVNEKWIGASARTRVNLPIKKGSDKAGWSSSEWLRAESEVIRMRFSVNSRSTLRDVMPVKNLLAGVQLVCDGWSVQDPKKGRGIQVDFHFLNYPARARAEFRTDLEHLASVERYLRFNVMGVTRADEMLAPAATAVAETTPEPPPPPPERGIRISGAQAQPEAASPGEAIELLITYDVSSGSAASVTVLERRVLAKGPVTIATFEESMEREPGTYVSRQTINVPPDAPAGFYSYKALVDIGDLSDEYNAIFEVR